MTPEEAQARIYELEDAMRVIMTKAGPHTVISERPSDPSSRDDPGFTGIYFVAGESLGLWGGSKRRAVGMI